MKEHYCPCCESGHSSHEDYGYGYTKCWECGSIYNEYEVIDEAEYSNKVM